MIGVWWLLQAQAEEPTAMEQRLSIAQTLAADPKTVEEARDILIGLLAVPELHDEALKHLVDLMEHQPARVGWTDTYRQLRSDRSLSSADRDLLTLRAGQAPPWTSAEQRKAITLLKGLIGHSVNQDDVLSAIGHLYLLQGSPSKALTYYQQVKTQSGILGEAYALVALDRTGDIKRMPSDDHLLNMAMMLPSSANRARVLFEAGYGYLARKVAGSPGTCVQDACAALAEIQDAKGDWYQEALAWEAYVKQVPSDKGGRIEWIHALLDAHNISEAAIVAAGDRDLENRVEAVRRVEGINSSQSLEERDQITKVAMGLADEPWQVRLARARVLTEQKKYEDAANLLLNIAEFRGNDPTILWALAEAGLRSGQTSEVLGVWHLAAQRAISPERRQQLGVDLAIVYGIIGEQYKIQGKMAEAILAYTTAIAMQPGRSDLYAGLGGVLWKQGKKDEARRAYMTSLALDPNSLDALSAAAILSVSLDEPDTATMLLSRAKGSSPSLIRARELVASAHSIAQAHAAAQGDPEEGRRTLRRMAADPTASADTLQAIGYAQLEVGDPAYALSSFHMAQKVRPDDPWLKLGEITALVNIPDLDGAERALSQLQQMDTTALDPALLTSAQVTLLRAKGNLARQAGDMSGALMYYQEVLRLDDNDGWTWLALGDLFLAANRPSLALAYYGIAGDPAQPIEAEREQRAHIGQIRCYKALGRLNEAEAMLDEGWASHASVADQEALELELRLARLDLQIQEGQYDEARRGIITLELRFPEQAAVHAAASSLALVQENPQESYDQALRGLQLDPSNVRSATLLLASAEQLGHLHNATLALQTAWEHGGSQDVLKLLSEARFLEALSQIREDLKRNQWTEAKAGADQLSKDVDNDPGRLSRLGGLWIEIGEPKAAEAAFNKALSIDPNLTSAILGQAGLKDWQGKPRAAARYLAEAYTKNPDPAIGATLAELYVRTGQKQAANEVLNQLSNAKTPTVARLDPVALPNGDIPAEEPVDARLDMQIQEEVEILTDEVSQPPRIDAAAGVGLMHQSGSTQSTYFFGDLLPVSLQGVHIGPVAILGDVIVLGLSDGTGRQQGVSADGGIELNFDQWRGSGRIGFGPNGFIGPVPTLWQLQGSFSSPLFGFGVETAQQPVTDSMASWVGGRAADGTEFGRVIWRWGGGWAELRAPSGLAGGARFQTGFLDGISLTPISRQAATLWVHRQLGDDDHYWRPGAIVNLLQNSQQADGFAPGEAAAFTPLGYAGGFAALDVVRTLSVDTRLCGGAQAGMESIQGTQTVWMSTGSHLAFAIHGSVQQQIGKHWFVNGSASWMFSAPSWSEEAGLISLQYTGGDRPPALTIPSMFGARLSQLGGC